MEVWFAHLTTTQIRRGDFLSVRDLIDAVARVSGHDVPVTEEARLPGGSPALIADPARIQ